MRKMDRVREEIFETAHDADENRNKEDAEEGRGLTTRGWVFFSRQAKMDDYPDSDFPWTFYFQGVAMPKWANCWHFCWRMQPVPDGGVDWDADMVWARLDHVGTIESEESDIFAIAAQQLLLTMLDQREAVLRELAYPPHENETIFQGLLSGLEQMIAISDKEDVVFWTSGYECDQEALVDAVRRYRLGEEHPDYFQPRHRVHRRNERLSRLNAQRRELRGRSATAGFAKELKRFLHQLKDRD